MSQHASHRTTDRILDILELIAQNNNKGMNFSDIAREMQMPKSSLHPLLHTLHQRKYLHYSAERQRYYLGMRLFILGREYVWDGGLLQAIQKQVSKLSGLLEETTFFAVLHNTDVLYLAKGEPDIPIRIVTAVVGHRNPASTTGLGKAMLLNYTYEQLCELYPETLPSKTELSIKTRDALWEQLQRCKADGFAYEKEESTSGIECLAVPIYYNSNIVAALSVSVPVYRFEEANVKKFKEALLQTKTIIEGLIMLNYEEWNRIHP